jgi:hypothetical protein
MIDLVGRWCVFFSAIMALQENDCMLEPAANDWIGWWLLKYNDQDCHVAVRGLFDRLILGDDRQPNRRELCKLCIVHQLLEGATLGCVRREDDTEPHHVAVSGQSRIAVCVWEAQSQRRSVVAQSYYYRRVHFLPR